MFKGGHFDSSINILCVRWYITYKLSYRDLRDMMAERSINGSGANFEVTTIDCAIAVCNWVRRLLLECGDLSPLLS